MKTNFFFVSVEIFEIETFRFLIKIVETNLDFLDVLRLFEIYQDISSLSRLFEVLQVHKS